MEPLPVSTSWRGVVTMFKAGTLRSGERKENGPPPPPPPPPEVTSRGWGASRDVTDSHASQGSA